jgi:hypothetical protein
LFSIFFFLFLFTKNHPIQTDINQPKILPVCLKIFSKSYIFGGVLQFGVFVYVKKTSLKGVLSNSSIVGNGYLSYQLFSRNPFIFLFLNNL